MKAAATVPASDAWFRRDEPLVRDELIARYLPWARTVARRVHARLRVPSMEWGDYVQAATIGLIEAVDRFDPAREVDFEAYARFRIRGEVFNAARACLKEDRRRVDPNELGRDRVRSLAREAGGDPLEQMMELVSGLAVGLLVESDIGSTVEHDRCDAYRRVEFTQIANALRGGLAQLPEREGLILELHYLQHVPFKDIAAALGVTKGRVSQLHKQAIERLRRTLSPASFDSML